MNKHQVLTGAVNAGNNCFSVGSVQGIPFTAYAAGCDLVILASNFQRTQIIPGIIKGSVQVGCVSSSTDTGKIAAAYGSKIYIYEPTPIIHQQSSHKLDYHWVQTGTIATDSHVLNLSWNPEGTRLLSSGAGIQLWHYLTEPGEEMTIPEEDAGVSFHFGNEEKAKQEQQWQCLWKCKTANPVYFLKFSPDGNLFASAGKNDRLVKIWHEDRKMVFPQSVDQAFQLSGISYRFIYLSHPRAITGLSWRQTSKYMPKNAVSNMLVSSCKDNICRIWVQTILPDDGLINLNQFEPIISQNPKLRTQKHKQKLMQRLKHMKSFFNFKTRHMNQFTEDNHETVPSLPSTFSVHDFHSFGMYAGGIAPGFHFHLSASINAETDIPLVPSLNCVSSEPNFVLHWLNNKELAFTLSAEKILDELSKKVLTVDTSVSDQSINNEDNTTKEKKSKNKPLLMRSRSDDVGSTNQSYASSPSSSSTSIATDTSTQTQQSILGDFLDHKIDKLVTEWSQSPDLLFSIHPVDGSFLVWLVEWLDEYSPSSFRQAQVSFSSRIPNALPLGDATSMDPVLSLYNPICFFDIKSVIRAGTEHDDSSSPNPQKVDHFKAVNNPIICMISKHANGTLNQWHLTFNVDSKYTQVLSIGYSARMCGHRFRVNDITCHPVLPLLLTTSHHNSVKCDSKTHDTSHIENSGFCSELILWKVDPVGPLSKSGGITELARIASFEISAFANVAWIPTLLPSTTLGSISNSPSACFIASDGHCLRAYQAVIDSRTLLAELSNSDRKNHGSHLSFSTSTFSGLGARHSSLRDTFKVVSQQSTARPGCIIQLDAISDATHDWHNTQFLHVFQEQLITGESMHLDATTGLFEANHQPIVDLHNTTVFEHPFYLVVIEKDEMAKSVLHMWKVTISSQPDTQVSAKDMEYSYVPDASLVQDDDQSNTSTRASSAEPMSPTGPSSAQYSPLSLTTVKVCSQELTLPEDVEIVHATPSAGHLSSSSIYPACFAPYIISTACSDNIIRFWKCDKTKMGDETNDYFSWNEWEMTTSPDGESFIDVPGRPLNVSCAYSGRIACAFKHGKSFTRPSTNNPEDRFINLSVAIYECESTGGSEWVLEDTIHLKNISLPKMEARDFIALDDDEIQRERKTVNQIARQLSPCTDLPRFITVPSYSTVQSLRKNISETGNWNMLTQKHIVQLDWVSTEDGSHILTVGVGSKVMLFTPVSSDIAQANIKAMETSKSASHPVLRKASSMAIPQYQPDEIRWMKLRSIDLASADNLPPLPMQLAWARDGILIVGMDNEMHVYSQWKNSACEIENESKNESFERRKQVEDVEEASRNLTDENLLTLAQDSKQLRIPSNNNVTRTASYNALTHGMSDRKKRKGKTSTDSCTMAFSDFGLFEASRIACPVLPQYHPKQLMELLNFGKIRRVKAILNHLVKCIYNTGVENKSQNKFTFNSEYDQTDSSNPHQRSWSCSRTLSVSTAQVSPMDVQASISVVPEEVQLDYMEITSIPPLPLCTLLAADKEVASKTRIPNNNNDVENDYSGLFATNEDNDQTLDDILSSSFDASQPNKDRQRNVSGGDHSLSLFGPRQARLLTRLLTHAHIPGLSSLDQMHLLALADTIASCNTAFADKFTVNADSAALAKETLTGAPGALNSTDSLDDCGLRFLLAMRHHNYLLRCLPLSQRAQLQKQGLGTAFLVWGYHSDSEEELLAMIPSMKKSTPKWAELREVGVGWWVRNSNCLRRCIEKVAKAAFQAKRDPLDASLYYLAMKKKSVIWGLFRSVGDSRMTAFFQNNFAEERWRKAALKNAFALLGKQRFEHAAAFFLLAGSVRDAVEVCLNKINDIQLAMTIVRLYEGDSSPNYRRILYEEILGCDKDGGNFNHNDVHPDPFLRSMAYWTLGDLSNSLNALLQNDVGNDHPATSVNDDTKLYSKCNPSVFNFYIYLRTHPLLIRQQIASSAQDTKKSASLMLSGFSASEQNEISEKQSLFDDAITPLERRLYFTTAHAHFLAGCPALALEVLSKLPKKIVDKMAASEPSSPLKQTTKNQFKDNCINTGTLESDNVKHTPNSVDWGLPATVNTNSSLDFDWGTPSYGVGKMGVEEKLNLSFSDSGSEKSEDDENPITLKVKDAKQQITGDGDSLKDDPIGKIDIMAQQLKFIACLKIMMEELSTLATGFEVDGGQLRFQLYIWLEQEVNALAELCNYGGCSLTVDTDDADSSKMPTDDHSGKPTLHQILLSDKLDFEAKLKRANRRKQWLKHNETLLRTLLSYCSLHGAHGGGLSLVRMELILLLQELQQEKTQQQLLSPLPFPTTLPLLSASVASCKTVVTDPIRNLQVMAHDILFTIVEMSLIGNPAHFDITKMFGLRDLSTSLSSCIYQALCDSDTVKNVDANASIYSSTSIGCAHSHLVTKGGRRRLSSSNFEDVAPTNVPSKWPGVQSLRALLAREKDDESPKLTTLLCESFVAVYLSLLLYAMSMYDCHILFRIIGQKFTTDMWVSLFGGGVKRLLKVTVATPETRPQPKNEDVTDGNDQDNLFKTLNKQRMMLNMKLLGQFGQKAPTHNIKEDRPTYREQFMAPEMSMITCFMSKPEITKNDTGILNYDSDDSVLSEEDEDEDIDVFDDKVETVESQVEHSDIHSYSWAIMQMAVVKLSIIKIQTFLNIAGIEMPELPVMSPLIHAALKALEQWMIVLKNNLDNFGGAPDKYLPGVNVEQIQCGPSINKYKCLLESSNTPFRSKSSSALPAKRLWIYLIHKKHVQDIFIRYVFAKRKPASVPADAGYEEIDGPEAPKIDPIKIIHKDQDRISSFCLNRASNNLLALSTPKEIQELDVNALMKPLQWLEDNVEYDIMNLHVAPEGLPASDYLVVQTPSDNLSGHHGSTTSSVIGSPTGPAPILAQPGRGAPVIVTYPTYDSDCFPLKSHKVDGIRRLCSHPILPLYLSGSQDGSVKLWEWGHSNPLSAPRQTGTFAKVTRVRFNEQGNKFGVSDGDGTMSLWQSGLSSNFNKAYYSIQCHTKQMSDFTFVGSSSLIASCGHSSDNRNVCLWDTLLPYKRSVVSSFVCHEHGSSSLVYGPHSQILISAGKKGDICIFDMRQRQLRHKFQAHDSAVKCMTLDPAEEFFVTGSADGDIKVWCLNVHNNYLTFPGEHSRSTFFRNIGVGVTQMYVDNYGRLFSCGADGSMKLRQLPDRDSVVTPQV